jgi:hypothetical protein
MTQQQGPAMDEWNKAVEAIATWHEDRAKECEAIASVNEDNDLGPDSLTRATDHRMAAEEIRRRFGRPTEEQIKHMVNRFLGWRLPENFNPDGGISFKKTFNDHMPQPMKHEPVGTNLFSAEQATEMVRYMLEGLPARE